MNILKGLNDRRKSEAINIILAKFREQNAVDGKFYNDTAKVQAVMSKLFDLIDTSDPFLESLIRIEATGPYSIFTYLLNENFSDIVIHKSGLIMSNSSEVQKIAIPQELMSLYHKFVNHFIENIMFISAKKFDTGNSILDAELGIFRFNLIHQSLTISGFHVIAVRKQTITHTIDIMDSESYLKSIEVSAAQAEVIHKYAYRGNAIVFGEVGSGKTTLIKYMGNYRLDDKRNLCTIEDTGELNLNVPIALLTNHHKNIKDLFTASLRENPSHIIIGETRTSEIVDILESALTISVITSIHANSFQRAIERIIFMSIERNIQPDDMRNLINSAVDCFIFMDDRKVKEVWEHKPDVTTNVYEAYQKVE